MNKRFSDGNIMNKRLLNSEELCSYVGLGKNTARRYADQVGATKHLGKRVVFDRVVLDKAIDQLNSN